MEALPLRRTILVVSVVDIVRHDADIRVRDSRRFESIHRRSGGIIRVIKGSNCLGHCEILNNWTMFLNLLGWAATMSYTERGGLVLGSGLVAALEDEITELKQEKQNIRKWMTVGSA